ncbi:MAG: ArsA family ATPase [Myxococcales bacterium]|nr:ArsA family ATPase [Myxococcales bacterium]
MITVRAPLQSAGAAALCELAGSQKLLVCVGSGGVGKTTTAASVALWAALAGRRVLVLTIDPARRLANSLGLTEIGNTEVKIPLERLMKAAGSPGGGPATTTRPAGELWAMMLDPKSTLDDVISRVSKDAKTRDAIFENRIYRQIAGSFSGSQEYMATERLYDVYGSGRYDLIVLDTPPVKNALDFLEAPGRLSRFLDRQVMKWFLTPEQDESAVSKRLLLGTSAVVYRLLGHIFGREFLKELSVFFTLFRDLYDGMRERHEAVGRIFGDARTSFVVVSAPNEPSVDVATFFLHELRQRKLRVGAVVVNQLHRARLVNPDVDALIGRPARELSSSLAAQMLARLGAAHRRLRDLAALERQWVTRLAVEAVGPGGGGLPMVEVDRQAVEVHDLVGLLGLHRWLFEARS